MVQGQMLVDSSASDVYHTLTDYDRAPDIFRNITESSCCTVGDRLEVTQACTWRFLVFKGAFKLVLDVADDQQQRDFSFRLKTSKFMKDFEGRWQIQPVGERQCHVMHTLSVHPVVAPPESLASYTSKIFVKQIRGVLEDLKAEMERQQA